MPVHVLLCLAVWYNVYIST